LGKRGSLPGQAVPITVNRQLNKTTNKFTVMNITISATNICLAKFNKGDFFLMAVFKVVARYLVIMSLKLLGLLSAVIILGR
jgi:hypothetical protein